MVEHVCEPRPRSNSSKWRLASAIIRSEFPTLAQSGALNGERHHIRQRFTLTSKERLQKSYASVLKRSGTLTDVVSEFARGQPAVVAAATTASMHLVTVSNNVEKRRLRLDWLRWVVESRVFAFSVLSLIFANAVLIAVSSEFLIRDAVAAWDAKNGKSATTLFPAWLKTADTVFTAVFFVELCLRLLALEGEFFTNRDMRVECS